MNQEKGYFRLTFVISILVGLVALIIPFGHYVKPIKFYIFAFGVGFALIWIIYFFVYFVVIKFIVKGFRDK